MERQSRQLTTAFASQVNFLTRVFAPLRLCVNNFCLSAVCFFSTLSLAHAATVQTLDGKSFDGDIRFSENSSLLVTPAQGEPVTIELTNLARATFASGPFVSSGSILPNGWAAQDIGETRGFARLDGNAFTLRVEGQSTNTTACHFVSRAMPTDGQLVARVEQIGGSGSAHAGIMIRGPGNSPSFVALSLGNDGKAWFHRRNESERREAKLIAVPNVTAPVWLRLQKYDKSVTASCSTDGVTWQTVATDTIKLTAEKTWRESEGELILQRASCGVFASSRARDTVATARVAPIMMTLQGLLGEYFAGQDFQRLKMARVDPQIRFNWGLGSPDPALDKDNFSVRWTGKLIAPKSGAYTFHFDADDRARLWINGAEIPQVSLKASDRRAALRQAGAPREENVVTPAKPIPLIRGQAVDLKMEFEEGEDTASVKLGWALPGQTPEVIGMTNFLYRFTATNSPESIALSRLTNNAPTVRGVLLRDGSFIAGLVTKADESAVRLAFGGRKDVPVLNSKIARIFLRPPQQPLRFEIAQGRTGVFTRSGDFFEGEFHSIESGSLNMSSVLFGLKRFGTEGSDSPVVVLNDCAPADSGLEVRLLDGSIFRASRLTAMAQRITINEPVLGSISIPTAELFEIRALGPRAAMAAANSAAKQ